MFICRHILLRTNIPRRLPTHLLSRRLHPDPLRFVSTAPNDTSPPTASGAIPGMQSPVTVPVAESNPTPSPYTPENDETTSTKTLLEEYQKPGCATSSSTHSGTIPPKNTPSPYTRAETTYSPQATCVLLEQPLPYFADTVRAAARSRDQNAIHALVTDVIEHGHRLPPCKYFQAVETILRRVPPQLLYKSQLLSLLRALEFRGQLEWLPDQPRAALVAAHIDLVMQQAAGPQLLDYFATLLLGPVRRRSLHDQDPLVHVPYLDIWLLYRIAYDLTRHGQQRRALDIIHALIDTRALSPDAVRDTDLASNDFTLIAVSVTLRSCLDFGWHDRAVAMLLHVLMSERRIAQELADLAAHVLGMAIDSLRPEDFVHAVSAAFVLMRRGPPGALPAPLLQEIYAAAQRLDQATLAEALFEQSRNLKGRRRNVYGPPEGAPLAWLMKYVCLTSKNAHLARELAVQVTRRHTPILLQDRGDFVALVAEQGFAVQARALWERYSVGKDRDVVVGHAAAMLRIVKLFGSMVKRRRSGEACAVDYELDDLDELAAIESATGMTPTTAPPPRPVLPPEPSSSPEAPQPSGLHADAGLAFPLASPQQEADDDLSGTLATQTVEADDAALADFEAFAERVLYAFEHSRTMHKAAHYELNALARAYFSLGKLERGFRVNRIMLSRRFIPDVIDVNVALGTLAEYKPAAAVRAMERMAGLGLQPTAATFGTLIHHAIVHSDGAMVSALIGRARQVGITRLSYKTVSTLIRAALTMSESAGVAAGESLRQVEELVDSLLDAGELPAPNMGRDCVIAALRADEPGAAFRFWRLLVKDKVEWGAGAEVRTRTRIGNAVARHVKAGWLDESQARVMLLELGMGDARHQPLKPDDVD